ncbi:MAG TPA: hypothetical protein VKB26_02110 [Candidatus Acidoferrales bacterium]|nr:hypothetical protein [Candidatus Acidoferrales bacterium]
MLSGILGTGAPATADANLILQIIMGVALFAGAALARMKKYTAHAVCQSTVLLINAITIAWLMWPSFRHTVLPRLPRRWHVAYYLWPTIHGLLGACAELLGIYIAMAASSRLLPKALKFRRWKFWMRLELVLWWFVLLSGVGTYLYWYTSLL